MNDPDPWTAPRVSPDGRFRITVEMYEAFNSHWVLIPTIEEVESAEVLLKMDRGWSMDESRWIGDHVVELTLRKYPGNHSPADLVATVDCVARIGIVGQGEMLPLGVLEANLNAALTWIYAEPAPPPPRNLLERILRSLRGE
jgi:hypothetical protein